MNYIKMTEELVLIAIRQPHYPIYYVKPLTRKQLQHLQKIMKEQKITNKEYTVIENIRQEINMTKDENLFDAIVKISQKRRE